MTVKTRQAARKKAEKHKVLFGGTIDLPFRGMLDGDISQAGHEVVKGRGCGNSVAVNHGGGWETYYCHLRRGSLTVRRDQRVEKGDKLGFVGSSGLAEFPHVHLGVRKDGKVIDPFVGLARRRWQ